MLFARFKLYIHNLFGYHLIWMDTLFKCPFISHFTFCSGSATPAIYGLILLCLALWPWLQGHLLRVWVLDDITLLQGLHAEVAGWRYSSPSKISTMAPTLVFHMNNDYFPF